jgi:hypothetical protein
MPSLSTTSSLHLILRLAEVSSRVSVGASSARNLRVAGTRAIDESRKDSVVVWSAFDIGWRVRDIVREAYTVA